MRVIHELFGAVPLPDLQRLGLAELPDGAEGRGVPPQPLPPRIEEAIEGKPAGDEDQGVEALGELRAECGRIELCADVVEGGGGVSVAVDRGEERPPLVIALDEVQGTVPTTTPFRVGTRTVPSS